MRERRKRGEPGNGIRKLREAAGKSQAEVAAALGVRQETVSAWETERSSPPVGRLRALAALLGTTIDALYPVQETGPESPEGGRS